MELQRTNEQLKEQALTHLSGKWGKVAMITLIIYLITGSVSVGIDKAIYPGVSYLGSILLLPLTYGFYIVFLRLKRTDNTDFDTVFEGFKEYFPILFTELLKVVYIMLWTLLLIVPGVVKSYSYAMTEYVMKDNPSMRYDNAIVRSMQLMQGHKMQLFMLDLSMIGWALLSLLTLGIGFLFLIPYNQTAHAEFYDQLLAEEGNADDLNTTDRYSAPIGEANRW